MVPVFARRSLPFWLLVLGLGSGCGPNGGASAGVDTPAGKNLVGAFHQPAAVIADTSVLATLRIEHLRAGIAEAIKHGVIADASYFDAVREIAPRLGSAVVDDEAILDLVARSVEIKAAVVSRDEREAAHRRLEVHLHQPQHRQGDQDDPR